MPLNYNNGKIYKIIDSENEIIYIGSTAQEKLCKRFSTHKHRGNGNKIVLLELYPCSCKEELVKKEQEHIDSHENLLNKQRAYNSSEYNKEYYKEYIEKWRKNNKEKLYKWRENNKGYYKEYIEKWRKNNKEKVKEYKIKHYQENRDKISEKNKVKVICNCGCEIRKDKLVRHMKSQKHIKFIESITTL